jgi:predicted extracellular nuclease
VPAERRYSYVYNAQSGYLDHMLATPPLAARVTGITTWHINSDEPQLTTAEPVQATLLSAPPTTIR